MKTLKQTTSQSFNARLKHAGTMWEARFRARAFLPDEKAELMKVAGYIDRNPVKAGIVKSGRPSQGTGRLQPELLHLMLPDAACGGGLHSIRWSPPFAAANVSPDGEGQEGIGMKLLHQSYSTNGVRPSAL